ncbi:MAG: polyphosphate kinase 2 family protein [Acidobacteriaceae bacterium]|nr:polyphosphate kinase 2 family protein [Acidobacteriaceae bacterium]
MSRKLPKPSKLIEPYRIEHGKGFRLKDHDPADTRGLHLKDEADRLLQEALRRLTDAQEKLYAQDRWALLLIFQGMDSAGKDSAIRHVMSGVNPEGCQVSAFKEPSTEELSHDFLWRASQRLPPRGRIGIFNRSYYEETLVVRVHAPTLRKERIPPSLVTKRIWRERFEDINAFERHLQRDGTVILKFFLHVSKDEQQRRFLARIDDPAKNWKFSEDDVREREHWDEYMRAYQDTIRHTAHPLAPWYVIPADHKWFAWIVVSSVVIETLEALNLSFPKVDAQKKEELAAARKHLLEDGPPA